MMVVVDASVFNKLFLNEPDRPMAQRLFRHAIQNDVPLLAPGLLLYEALSAALHYEVPFSEVHNLLALQRAAGMRIVEPSLTVLECAHDIACHGNTKTGYPTLQDCIYHALAIEEKATFVTADRRHYSKTKSFGSIETLEELVGKLDL